MKDTMVGASVCSHFLGVLGCILVMLKISNLLEWSWYRVSFPFWGIYIVYGGICGVDTLYTIIKKKVINILRKL